MQASTMMGMSPRLICCSCSPVPPPPAAPPMAAFHAEKSSRLSPCRYRVLRPQRPESEPATEGPLRHPGSQVPDFPEPPAGGSNTQPRQGPCTREGTLRKQAGGGPAGCGLCSRKTGGSESRVEATLTFLSQPGPNAPSCLGCQLRRLHLGRESLEIVIIVVFIIMTNIYAILKVCRCQARSLTNNAALNPMSYILLSSFYK